MIVDLENKFIIGTPTKCGTTSIENLAKSRGDRLGLAAIRPRQHRMVVPQQYENYDRYMMVRSPYDRLVSIYLYLTNPSNYSQWSHWEVKDYTFKEFVDWYVRMRDFHKIAKAVWEAGEAQDLSWYKSPNLWLVSLGECSAVLEPKAYIRLEHLSEDLQATGRVDWGGKQLHANRSTNRSRDSRHYYNKWCINKVNEAFAAYDCEVLDYDMMEE